MEQSPSLECSSSSREIAIILWNQKVHYHVYKSPLRAPVLSQTSAVCDILHISLRLILRSFSSISNSKKLYISFRFSHQNSVCIFHCFTVHFNSLNIIYQLMHFYIQDARTHIKRYAATSLHWLFTFLTNFKISDINKEHTSSLKMIWMMIETRWSVFKCFNMDILD